MLTSETAAEMTTAASAVCGRFRSKAGRNTSRTVTMPAPTSPVTWLLDPADSATALREPLTETANPWNNPAKMFDEPTPIISWFGSTSSPRRAAKLVDVAIVSVSETRTMPTAAPSSGATSEAFVHGTAGTGSPRGSVPTTSTPFDTRSSSPTATVAPTTATRTAGTFFDTSGSSSSTASVARPSTSVVAFVWSSPVTNALISSTKPSASVENPNSFGSCPTTIVIARPFMYPTCTSLDSRSATNPSLAIPSPISIAPTKSASMPASAIATSGPPPATSGTIAAKISGDTEESGPSTSTREGPISAYATRQATVVYRPVTAGRPASSA